MTDHMISSIDHMIVIIIIIIIIECFNRMTYQYITYCYH